MTSPMIRLSPRVRFRAVADEGVLVQLETQRVLVVSDVGLRVIRCLERGPSTLDQLALEVAGEFEVEVDRARQDIEAFVGDLSAEQALLVEPSPERRGDT